MKEEFLKRRQGNAWAFVLEIQQARRLGAFEGCMHFRHGQARIGCQLRVSAALLAASSQGQQKIEILRLENEGALGGAGHEGSLQLSRFAKCETWYALWSRANACAREVLYNPSSPRSAAIRRPPTYCFLDAVDCVARNDGFYVSQRHPSMLFQVCWNRTSKLWCIFPRHEPY